MERMDRARPGARKPQHPKNDLIRRVLHYPSPVRPRKAAVAGPASKDGVERREWARL